MKILCIGEEWRGSNASGLFYALSRLGYVVHIVNELNYISVKATGIGERMLNRVLRPFQVVDFNRQLKTVTQSFHPDLILVYKGAFLMPETMAFWRKFSIPVVNFFPDVSFLAHGRRIPACLSLYDHIFSTKTFAAMDLNRHFDIDLSRVSFVPHGFDPLIHRPIIGDSLLFSCQASFIGNYSAHKASYLEELQRNMPNVELKIWGQTWSLYKGRYLGEAIQSTSVTGDLYALAISNSAINIGLLSERVQGASSGDQITSRTFHIPAAGGFMLHQRTKEVQQYFVEDSEMVCFESKEELVDKIAFYLKADSERERIRTNGHRRALSEHSIDERAKCIMKKVRSLL